MNNGIFVFPVLYQALTHSWGKIEIAFLTLYRRKSSAVFPFLFQNADFLKQACYNPFGLQKKQKRGQITAFDG